MGAPLVPTPPRSWHTGWHAAAVGALHRFPSTGMIVSSMNVPGISTFNESPLHADLKQWYARDKDKLEVPVAGYVVDIVRDGTLIEIQTGHFGALRAKLRDLLPAHTVRLVYPIAQTKWIVKLPRNDNGSSERRRSPKRGTVYDLFDELVRLPDLLAQPNFAVEVLLIEEEEIRRHSSRRRWRRRGWTTVERRLLRVIARKPFDSPAMLVALLPPELPQRFTTADIAATTHQRRTTAQRMAYCLRELQLIRQVGKVGNAYLYERQPEIG